MILNFKLTFCIFYAKFVVKLTHNGALIMLINFKIRNFRSLKDELTFNLTASPATELMQNTCAADSETSLRLLRAAVIYGANAGGKSNLLSALLFMRKFIIASAKESQPGEKIPVDIFKFDKVSRQKPSEFEVTFIKEDVRYQYGFIIDEKRIYEEWLYAYPSNRPQQWFNRHYQCVSRNTHGIHRTHCLCWYCRSSFCAIIVQNGRP